MAVLRRGIGAVAAVLVCSVLSLLPLGGRSNMSERPVLPYLPASPHQAYGYRLADAGFVGAPARDWLLASEHAVLYPAAAELPLAAEGRFESGAADAVGFRFRSRGGRRLSVVVTARTAMPRGSVANAELFVDLFSGSGGSARHLRSTPPLRAAGPEARHSVELAVLDDADYLLRVQPSLEFAGAYSIDVRSEPLLSFPVRDANIGAVQSGFGAARDGGARSHRGVDIFAPRGTEALAAMDAWVSRVDTTPRGGNVVWLRPVFGNMRLYYAHLEAQLVEPGDFVLAGDPIGTVGNTGNARTTPPHLHFGVYVRERGRRGGARDPYPFLD